ncbi:MAG: hypothetical protein FOGNACKC_02731 [Anaerolineae bacterium]|nr:hypothetical protein [Anaerolineae bacterium]
MVWAVGLLLLALGGWLFVRSIALRRRSGLPHGRLVYADTHGHNWQPAPQPLFSAKYQLVGKPDYLVQTPAGLIPVEVKTGAAPRVPYLGHILQLAAYCLLVEETTGQTPPHGLLKYADALFEVDFNRDLRAELMQVMAEVRQARLADEAPRSHDQPGKCAACGFVDRCDEALR